MDKRDWISILIVSGVIILAIIIINNKGSSVSEETAKCIGENSVLYVRLGCPHCKEQEDIFGKSLQYLKIIDCFYEEDKCSEIKYVPTWVIEGKQYTGVLDIEKLKELTGC